MSKKTKKLLSIVQFTCIMINIGYLIYYIILVMPEIVANSLWFIGGIFLFIIALILCNKYEKDDRLLPNILFIISIIGSLILVFIFSLKVMFNGRVYYNRAVLMSMICITISCILSNLNNKQ